MPKNTQSRKNPSVNNKTSQTSNKKIKLTPVSESSTSNTLETVLVNMETNKNSTTDATSPSIAVKNKLSKTQLGKQPEVAMKIISTLSSKIFQTPSWDNLVNEVSNTLNNDDVTSISLEFLQDTIVANNSIANETGNVLPSLASINDVADEEFITIFKPSKFVSSIQQTVIPGNMTQEKL